MLIRFSYNLVRETRQPGSTTALVRWRTCNRLTALVMHAPVFHQCWKITPLHVARHSFWLLRSGAHMYDEQIERNADSPLPLFAKESVSPALLQYAGVVDSHRNSFWLVFTVISEEPLDLRTVQRNFVSDVKNLKLIVHTLSV